jgi:aerobic carbon-monoxide dehydrogenase large subunit
VEDQPFLTGQGRYAHAHARIKNVHTSKAKAAPGVLLVLTGVDVGRDQLGGFRPT